MTESDLERQWQERQDAILAEYRAMWPLLNRQRVADLPPAYVQPSEPRPASYDRDPGRPSPDERARMVDRWANDETGEP
jgi:hypothetical protein